MSTLQFLKVESDGRDQIPGESKDPDHRGWIEVLAFHSKVAAPITTTGVKGGPTAQLILFVTPPGPSTVALNQAMASNTKIKRMILHIVETKSYDKTVVEHEMWWEFLDAQVKSVVLNGSHDSTGGSNNAKHISRFDSRITVEVSFAYKSLSHRFGRSNPDRDEWVGAAAKPAAGRVTAGMAAAATHMLRQHQNRLS